MPIKITLALFGHIQLDSHASERFKIEGNTFFNTFAYLNQYFKTLSNLSPKLQQLASAMNDLVLKENEIIALFAEETSPTPSIQTGIMQRLKSLVSLFERSPQNKLDAFLSKTLKEINRLQAKQFLLLPGGWRGNITSPGHAMIYQFERDEDGDLLFSIDNSGAGLDFHEKSSSKEKELFSSTKIYKIPQPIDDKELKNLIKRLITPQYKLLPFPQTWDAKVVYENIHASLRFLNAKHMLQDLSDSRKTTGGQLSGTCSQRSIHQMLKMNFDTLAEYQQFIFAFKMYALRDFLSTYPAPSRSPQVNAFIQKAIINNLKILRMPGVFPTQLEQDAVVSELTQIQHGLKLHENTMMTALLSLDINHYFLFHFIDSLFERFLADSLVAPITAFDTLVGTKVDKAPSFLPAPNDDHFLDDLNAIIQQCQIQSHQNPLWVMMQIEQTVLELPIPITCKQKKPYYNVSSTLNF